MTFPGFRRPDGQVGVRNHVLVIPTVVCANQTACAIAEGLPAVALPHVYGCAFDSRENVGLERVLAALGCNPNVAAVLVVSLGCETASMDAVVGGIARSNKPVEGLRIQDAGTPRTIARGREIVERFLQHARTLPREECPLSDLVLAVECGASDAFSGLSANPAVGAAADLLVAAGGTVILSETTEIVGAEHLLARRAVDEETRRRLLTVVARTEGQLRGIEEFAGGVYITPGNIAGGLTTLEEKSLGCIHKGGTTPVVEVVGYGERPTRRGLVVMDTPGHDIMSMVGKVAGGAQVICFTTGRGTPTGNPIAPVIKVCSNSQTAQRMADNIDIDAGTILTGEESISAVGRRVFQKVVSVAGGEQTRAEVLGHAEFAIGTHASAAAGQIGTCCA
ncbi:MAG: UxaA family hydrolase [Armatimonadota bacterium]|nr:UxaA family hydrolase [Armatimonadota bacterium]